MLPGRAYGPHEILQILWGRKWIIVGLVSVGAAISIGLVRWLPKQYRSEALLMVVPQRIPESYVKATVTEKVEDRLATLSDRTLSRARLQQTILDFDLYRDRVKNESMEDVVLQMKRDVKIAVNRNETISVSFTSADPVKAQQVAERLASLFITENSQDRESQAQNTSEFLEAQLEDAKRRLMEHERKLEDYRRRYSGQLPEQGAANLQVVQGSEAQRLSLADALNRARERRTLVDRQLLELQSADPIVRSTATSLVVGESSLTTPSPEQRLVAARKALEALRATRTPLHPDLRAAERRVADLEAELRDRPVVNVESAQPAGLDPMEAARLRRVRDLEMQLADIDLEIKEKVEADARLRGRISEYQNRLEALPTRQSELVELTRDYETLQGMYQSLLTKKEESKISADLERESAGEQFRIIEPPVVPQRPTWPNVLFIYLGGIGGGLFLALALIGLGEYVDSSIRTEDDIARVLKVPVLAAIPVLALEGRRDDKRGLLSAFLRWRRAA